MMNESRKVCLIAFAASMLHFVARDSEFAYGQSALPNIILMMGDDHGWEETGYNGHPHVKTPILDEMARNGLRFDRFYAAHPTCSPTRASFLTGRHPNRMGTFAPGWSFRQQEITIAHVLSPAGYRCGHFGKWHLGAVKKESPVSPLAMGFHECLSHDNFFELNPTLSRNGESPEKFQGESSEVIISEAIRFLDATHEQGNPCLAVIWFGSPHEPYSGLPEDLQLYDDLPAKFRQPVKLTSNETGAQVSRPQGEVLRERYAEITAMDRSIGKLRVHLSEHGMRDNTLLFYCGDNGTSADAALRTPHRGVKGQVYDGGILVPGLIEWPDHIALPRATQVRASTSDLLPTICGLTGQPLPNRPLDGVDLTRLLDGHSDQRSNPIYFWQYATANINSKRDEPWIEAELQQGTTPLAKLQGGKATRDFSNFRHPVIRPEDFRGARAIIEADYKLVIHEQKDGQPKHELFNLQTDPAEQSNLAAQLPELARTLKDKLLEWQSSVLNSLTGADY